MSIQEELVEALRRVIASHFPTLEAPSSINLDRPKNRDHGDFASSIALALAKPAGLQPRDVATQLIEGLKQDSVHSSLDAIDIAGPGFINFKIGRAHV